MSQSADAPALRRVRIADPPKAWEALGFLVRDGTVDLGGVRVELAASGRGIVGWGLSSVGSATSLDGLATEAVAAGERVHAGAHPNGAVAIDHVVIATPDFDRTAQALDQAGLGLRRVHRVPGSRAMGFRRLGQAILELVETTAEDPSGPAGFWGLAVIVEDLDALAERLGAHLGPVHPAVQPGRRIASLKASAGLGQAVAFMTPE